MNNHRNPLCEFAEHCILYLSLDKKLLDYCHNEVENCEEFKDLYRQKRRVEKYHLRSEEEGEE